MDMDVEVWARTLATELQEHLADDREVLSRYSDLVRTTSDERIRYLVHLILDDAVRHQRMLQEMVNWLRAESESRTVSGPRVPDHEAVPNGAQAVRDSIALAGEVLDAERGHERRMRELRHRVESVRDTAWWGVLLLSMELDTRKHVRMLEHIRSSLAS